MLEDEREYNDENDELLRIWLEEAYKITFPTKNYNYNEKNMDIPITEIGRVIFSLPERSDFFDIVNAIKDNYQVDLLTEVYGKETLIEYLLIHALSSKCEKREDYVRGIINMDEESQHFLMQIIQDSMSAHHHKENPEVKVEEDNRDSVTFCKNCQLKEAQIHGLRQEITNLTSKLEDTEAALAKVSDELSKEVAAEFHERERLIEQEETIRHLTDELDIALNKILESDRQMMNLNSDLLKVNEYSQELERKVAEFSSNNAKFIVQIAEMTEELEVLRPKADKVDVVEVQLDKLRSKLEELQEVKQQLKTESASHNQTFSKMVDYEIELDNLRKATAQLEEYRNQNTELTLHIDEQKLKLEEKEFELTRLREENATLVREERKVITHTQALEEELRVTSERLREIERVGGVGDGMSELNPSLMEELFRLRAENQDLRRSIQGSSLDIVEELRKQLTDERVRSSSTHSKWIQTQLSLEKALTEIETCNGTISARDKEVRSLQLKNAELNQALQQAALPIPSLHSNETGEKPSYDMANRNAEEDLNDMRLEQLRRSMTGLEAALMETRGRVEELAKSNREKDDQLLKISMERDEAVRGKTRMETELMELQMVGDEAKLKEEVSTESLQEIKDQLRSKFEEYIKELSEENAVLKERQHSSELQLLTLQQERESRELELRGLRQQLSEEKTEVAQLQAKVRTSMSFSVNSPYMNGVDPSSGRRNSVDGDPFLSASKKSMSASKKQITRSLLSDLDSEMGTALVSRGLPTSEHPFMLSEKELETLDDVDELRDALKLVNAALIETAKKVEELNAATKAKETAMNKVKEELELLHQQKLEVETAHRESLSQLGSELSTSGGLGGETMDAVTMNEIKKEIKQEFESYINEVISENAKVKTSLTEAEEQLEASKKTMDTREADLKQVRQQLTEALNELNQWRLRSSSSIQQQQQEVSVKSVTFTRSVLTDLKKEFRESIRGSNQPMTSSGGVAVAVVTLTEEEIRRMSPDELRITLIDLNECYLHLQSRQTEWVEVRRQQEETISTLRYEVKELFDSKVQLQDGFTQNMMKLQQDHAREMEALASAVANETKSSFESYIQQLTATIALNRQETIQLEADVTRLKSVVESREAEIKVLRQKLSEALEDLTQCLLLLEENPGMQNVSKKVASNAVLSNLQKDLRAMKALYAKMYTNSSSTGEMAYSEGRPMLSPEQIEAMSEEELKSALLDMNHAVVETTAHLVNSTNQLKLREEKMNREKELIHQNLDQKDRENKTLTVRLDDAKRELNGLKAHIMYLTEQSQALTEQAQAAAQAQALAKKVPIPLVQGSGEVPMNLPTTNLVNIDDTNMMGSLGGRTEFNEVQMNPTGSGPSYLNGGGSGGYMTGPREIIEEITIGAKKDPDQEALEHGILLSLQQAEYGINMYDALKPQDELTIDEYILQGFTREEAILLIFEENYGKVSSQSKSITPALPHVTTISQQMQIKTAVAHTQHGLHPQAQSMYGSMNAASQPSQLTVAPPLYHQKSAPTSQFGSTSSPDGRGGPGYPHTSPGGKGSGGVGELSPADEQEIQFLMSRGYDREAAIAIYRMSVKPHHRSVSPRRDEPTLGAGGEPVFEVRSNDPEVRELIGRGFRLEQAMKITAEQRKATYQKKQQQQQQQQQQNYQYHQNHPQQQQQQQQSTYPSSSPQRTVQLSKPSYHQTQGGGSMYSSHHTLTDDLDVRSMTSQEKDLMLVQETLQDREKRLGGKKMSLFRPSSKTDVLEGAHNPTYPNR